MENLQSTSLNRGRVDNVTANGFFNNIHKCRNGGKSNLSVFYIISSDNETENEFKLPITDDEKMCDRKKREHEQLLLNELYKKKKREENEKKIKEDNEREKKKVERKIKDLQKKIKMEVEHKKLGKKEQKETEGKVICKKLKEYHEGVKKVFENIIMEMRLEVTEEIVDECVDDNSEEIKEDIVEADMCKKHDKYKTELVEGIKMSHNQIQKQIITTTQFEKPPHKKRGRKHRIDIQNEKQESNSINKPTSHESTLRRSKRIDDSKTESQIRNDSKKRNRWIKNLKFYEDFY